MMAGAVAVLGVFAMFSLAYWNRFLNVPVSGVFVYVAEQILHHKVPYRDFFLIVPPAHPLKLAALTYWFGDALIVGRIEALLERALLAVMVYVWLTRYFAVSSAVLGTLVGMVAFAGDPADALVSYHHDSVLWAVLSGFGATLAVSSRRHQAGRWALLSGVLAGLCFQTKQTTGAGITLAVPVLVLVAAYGSREIRSGLRVVAAFATGWSLPNAMIVAWLAHEGALQAFAECVFLNTGAKGAGLALWLRPITYAPVFVGAGLFLALLLIRSARSGPTHSRPIPLWVLSGSFVLVLGAGLAFSDLANLTLIHAGMRLQALVIVGAMAACAVFLGDRGWRVVRGAPKPPDVELWMFSGVALAIAYMLGLSWFSYGPMAIPAVSLLFAAIAERCLSLQRSRQVAVLVLVFLVVFVEAHRKYAMPSGWMSWSEPSVLQAQHSSTMPRLAGLRLSKPTLEATETVTRLVRAHSRPDDHVLVFPYFPLFYVLADRTPPTYAFVHFLDVTPDALAERDARRLRDNPPAVIVYLDRPTAVVEAQEAVYRGGRPSGERHIMAAIRGMADRYTVLTTIHLPGTGFPLHVLARNDRRVAGE